MGKRYSCISEWSWIFSEGVGTLYGAHLKGEDPQITTLHSAKPFFYFLDDNKIVSHKVAGAFGPGTAMFYEKDFNPKESWGEDWTPPPYKEHFGKISPIKSEKPIIVINNKYNPEWLAKIPKNFLPLDFLKEFLDKFSDEYQIYYMRYDSDQDNSGYFDDVPSAEEYADYNLLKNYPNVITIYDFMKKHNTGFNESQLLIMSKAKHIISVNGGSAVLSAYFGEDVVIYGHPDCKSTTRGVWFSDSWLKEMSGANIIGHLHWAQMLNDCEERWL